MAASDTCDIDDLLAGLQAQRAGRVVEAELAYRRVLARAPDDARGAYLLGLLTLATGRAGEAELLLRHALALRPEDLDTRHALARACAATGAGAEAIDLYRAVLAARPLDAAVWVNLANALCAADALAEAAEACAAALRVQPELVPALTALGAVRLAGGDGAAAAALYRRAIALRPEGAAAQAGLALALLQTGDAGAALAAGEAAVALDPDAAEAWYALGTARHHGGAAEAALAALERAVRLDPGHARAWMNLGHVAAALDRAAVAERALRMAVARAPGLAEAHASLGALLSDAERLEEAVAACAQALALRPGCAVAHWTRGFALLRGGDFARGWADFEWRKRHPRFAAGFAPLPAPAWRGEALAGRSILLRGEQGLGDTIQFARFIPVLAAMGARVVLCCQPSLRRLLGQLPVEIVEDAAPPATDFAADLMSLPLLLETRVESIPAARGYLLAPPPRRGGRAGRVGLVWAGNPAHSNDARRSLPPQAVAAVLAAAEAAPALHFTSLQVGPRAGEAVTRYGVADLSARLTDFAETAAVIDGLDLVVTVDSAVAHLAGAMGKPVWVLLPFAADWRWLTGRTDSPWYASMRLFRQSAPGDWARVAARVAAALIARYRGGVGIAGANLAVASVASAAATAVATPPQAISTTLTSVDQPASVARLVMSYVP